MTAILKGNCKQSLDCLFFLKKSLNMSHKSKEMQL